MKKFYSLFVFVLLSLATMAETIEISTDSYAYNEWNVKNSQWYIAFNTSDALYTVKLYIEVEEREFPTPYGHKTLAQIDAEKSFIKERTGSKQTFTFTAAELHLTHQGDGRGSNLKRPNDFLSLGNR